MSEEIHKTNFKKLMKVFSIKNEKSTKILSFLVIITFSLLLNLNPK